MKFFAALAPAIALTFLASAGSAAESSVPECSEAQLLAYAPTVEQRQAHRKFSVPTLTYPFGTQLKDRWSFDVRLRVEPSGAVACYSMERHFGRKVELNERRRAVLERLHQWRYQPFLQNGKPVAAVVREDIREEEAPQAHKPMPDVPLDRVHIGLRRTMCFGPCPMYSVDVYGDGRVVYNGEYAVDVVGEVVYRIAPERVAKLVDSLRSKDIWSLRDLYQASITDSPSHLLTLELGNQVQLLVDYVGEMVGMPKAVSDFEDEIDEVSGAIGMVNLSKAAVERLEAQKFDFQSQAGADLLARAVSNKESRDDEAMLRLLELGVPIVGGGASDDVFGRPVNPVVIVAALLNQRAMLIDALIQRGALQTDGAPDQSKIDFAFRAAVASGRLELVEKIWAVAGAKPHPSLLFEDVSESNPPIKKVVPVTLLLKHSIRDQRAWEGLAVTQWLAARGCDLKATGVNGDTLLHIAARAGDAELVRYLLSQGLDASTAGPQGGLPALGSTTSEDVALLLLEAGADPAKVQGRGWNFRTTAKENHWVRVLDWLDSH